VKLRSEKARTSVLNEKPARLGRGRAEHLICSTQRSYRPFGAPILGFLSGKF